MSFSVTQKISLGFTLLVISILVVGGGGLWGSSHINKRLHQITERSLPLSDASSGQLISLQQAGIAILKLLAEQGADNETREHMQQQFEQQLQLFDQQQERLLELVGDDAQLQQLSNQTASIKAEYATAAAELMGQHQQQISTILRVKQKQSRFQRQIDSLSNWGQQYISRAANNPNAALGEARSLMRATNDHKSQLINYQQSGDFPALEEELNDTEGELQSAFDELLQADSSSGRVKVLIRDLNEQLYSDNGLTALYRQAYQGAQQLEQQLHHTEALLQQSQDSAQQMSQLAQQRSEALEIEADQASQVSQMLIIALLIGATLLAIVTSLASVRAISRPLRKTLILLAQLAEGDMQVRFPQKQDDEFGRLGRALNTLVEQLSTTLNQISSGADQLNRVAESNAEISRSTTDSMANQSQQLELTSSAAAELESTVAEVANHAESTLVAVQQCNQLGSDATEQVRHTHERIEQQSRALESAVEDSDQLRNYGQQIDSILETIGDIAEQTNLLALNAAIESARAGEHGRGFAVVADEVRKLAGRTQNSTHEIQQMVENMQTSIRRVSDLISESVEQSRLCVSSADSSREALEQIDQATAEIHRMSTQITEAATQQKVAVEEVSRTLVAINQDVGDTTSGAEQVSHASEQLVEIAHHQQQLINHFKLPQRSAIADHGANAESA